MVVVVDAGVAVVVVEDSVIPVVRSDAAKFCDSWLLTTFSICQSTFSPSPNSCPFSSTSVICGVMSSSSSSTGMVISTVNSTITLPFLKKSIIQSQYSTRNKKNYLLTSHCSNKDG